MKLTMRDHDYCLKLCRHPKATDDERDFLSFMAAQAVANEPVTKKEYLNMRALMGGALSDIEPIPFR